MLMGKRHFDQFRQVSLNDERRRQLETLATSGLEDEKTIARAKAVLLGAKGYSDQEVEDELGLTSCFVQHARIDYLNKGVDGLISKRRGRPVSHDSTTLERLRQLLTTEPPYVEGSPYGWSIRKIANELELSKNIVHRLLHRENIDLDEVNKNSRASVGSVASLPPMDGNEGRVFFKKEEMDAKRQLRKRLKASADTGASTKH